MVALASFPASGNTLLQYMIEKIIIVNTPLNKGVFTESFMTHRWSSIVNIKHCKNKTDKGNIYIKN